MVVLVSLSLPASAADRLTWLAAQEDEHRAEIDAAWEVILGPDVMREMKAKRGR